MLAWRLPVDEEVCSMVTTAREERPRIVAAIDGGGLSADVLLTAKVMAPLFHAEVGALHVVEAGEDLVQARRRAAEARVPLQVLEGPVLSTLAARCAAHDVAAVVIGASAGRGAARALGHRALGLITATQRPVVVVPAGADVPLSLRRALLPLDASAQTQQALIEAVELARAQEVDVLAMHVHTYHDIPMFSDQPQHEVPAWSAEFLRRYWPGSGPHPQLRLHVGVPADEIVAAVMDAEADLLILGWSQDLSLGRARVVRTALLESRRPVLLLPVRANEAAPELELAGRPRQGSTATAVSAGVR
jgi:nucleotide-binding universal stress UspA family protein